MKKLIIINTILIILFIILPREQPNIINIEIMERKEEMLKVQDEIMENKIVEEKEIEENEIEENEAMFVTDISKNCIDLIKQFEGLCLTAYKLPGENIYTIGYGHHSSNIYKGQVITQEQAENFLKEDLQNSINRVKKLNLELNQNEFDALVSFDFNCTSECLIQLTKNRTKQEIAEHITAYTNSSSESHREGLKRRRNAEKELFLKEI